MSVTKTGLAGTNRRDGRDRTMGRGLSEYVGLGKCTDVLSLVREYIGGN